MRTMRTMALVLVCGTAVLGGCQQKPAEQGEPGPPPAPQTQMMQQQMQQGGAQPAQGR
jgi:hypothetical protein